MLLVIAVMTVVCFSSLRLTVTLGTSFNRDSQRSASFSFQISFTLRDAVAAGSGLNDSDAFSRRLIYFLLSPLYSLGGTAAAGWHALERAWSYRHSITNAVTSLALFLIYCSTVQLLY